MKVDSVYTDVKFVDDRIKSTIVKTVVDETTNKKSSEIETYYQTYDKKGNIKTEETHSVDKKV